MSDLKILRTESGQQMVDYDYAKGIIEQQQAEIEALKTYIEELTVYEYKEIGESGWMRCTKEQFEHCQKSPEHDTRKRIKSLAEQHPDDEAVNKFAYQMKCKLAIARSKGRSGWDNPNLCTVESLVDMLVEHLQKPNAGNWIDIANFCMMLHLRGANPRLLVNALAERDAEESKRHFMYGYHFCRANGFLFDEQLQEAANEYAQRIKDGGNKC